MDGRRGAVLKNQTIFKRYELKYIITEEQAKELRVLMEPHMYADKHGRSTICNIYFDTPNYLLIRRSTEKPEYKEKIRLRSYGPATHGSTTFAEIKKKYRSVVYKRRIALPEQEAMKLLAGEEEDRPSQIAKEIAYCVKLYEGLRPALFLSYEREAFYATNDYDFRLTFDRNILWRTDHLSLCEGVWGSSLIEEGQVLMEIKTSAAIPLWLTHWLSENKIYKRSFSKYGTIYLNYLRNHLIGGEKNASQFIQGTV